MDLLARENRWATDTAKVEPVYYNGALDQQESARRLYLVAVVRIAPYILETAGLTVLVLPDVVVTANEDVPGIGESRSLTEPTHEVVVVLLVPERLERDADIHEATRTRVEVGKLVGEWTEHLWFVRSGRSRHQSDQNHHRCQQRK